MRCDYCFYCDEMRTRQTAVHPPMSMETLEHTLRRLFAFADEPVSIAFQGGEPTLAGAAFYREVLRLERRYNARHLPITHALQTNGLCLDDDMLETLKQGDFLVGLSVDGTQALHDAHRKDAHGQDTYTRVMNTAKRLQEKKIPFNVLCVVDHQVAAHGQEVLNALRPFQYLQFIPCLDSLAGTSSPRLDADAYGRFLIVLWQQYAALMRAGKPVSIRLLDNWLNMLAGMPPESCAMRGQCGVSLVIESNGDVYPCDFYATDEWHLGNVNDGGFSRILHSPILARFLNRSVPVPSRCKSCSYANLCRNGCFREREAMADTAPVNRLCSAYRAFFDACLADMLALRKQLDA